MGGEGRLSINVEGVDEAPSILTPFANALDLLFDPRFSLLAIAASFWWTRAMAAAPSTPADPRPAPPAGVLPDHDPEELAEQSWR